MSRQTSAFVLLVVLSAVIGSYAVHSQMPTNALELPGEGQLRPALRVLLPQGWAFFTRSPREERYYTYRKEVDGWSVASLGPHSEAGNLFGLDRRSRAQGVELGLLHGVIPGGAWHKCAEHPLRCLDGVTPISVSNRSPAPTLCGEIGIALQEPVPWAWSSARAELTMPSRVVRLEISC